MKKIIEIFKSKNGISELYSTIVGLMCLVIMLSISINFLGVLNAQIKLNEFATQMLYTVCDEGKTSGTEIDTRYAQLETSLGISPEIIYSATYFDSADGSVQYGDLITLTASYSSTFTIWKYTKTMDYEIIKTGCSEVYYK